MKTFKQYVSESQWMYHGTPHEFDTLKPNRREYMLDRAIGSHFAADPTVSDKFAQGLYKDKKNQGRVLKTKAPTRSKLVKVYQKKYKHGARQSDQYAIQNHVMATVFHHDKDMFKQYVKTTRHVDDETAEALHDHLSRGIAPHDKTRFGLAATKGNTFRSFVNNFGAPHGDDFKEKLVHRYLGIMRDQGKEGLVYHNTSPSETPGARSTKSYVIFNPEKHKLEPK